MRLDFVVVGRASRRLLVATLVGWLVVAVLGAALLQRGRVTPVATSTLVAMPLRGHQGALGHIAFVPAGHDAVLWLVGRPPLPYGATYTCWLSHDGQVERAEDRVTPLDAHDATILVRTARSWAAYASIGLTVETAPRPTRPTAPFFVQGALR